MISTVRLMASTPSSTRRTSPKPVLLVSAAADSRERRPSRRAMSTPSRVPKDMTPNPPIWIRAMITTLPKPLQYTGVSTVISPVTQTDDVDVNRASRKGAPSGPFRETGSMSSTVPTATAAANPSTITWAGCCGAKTLRMRGKTFEPPAPQPAEPAVRSGRRRGLRGRNVAHTRHATTAVSLRAGVKKEALRKR